MEFHGCNIVRYYLLLSFSEKEAESKLYLHFSGVNNPLLLFILLLFIWIYLEYQKKDKFKKTVLKSVHKALIFVLWVQCFVELNDLTSMVKLYHSLIWKMIIALENTNILVTLES